MGCRYWKLFVVNQGGVITTDDLPARIRLQPAHDTPPLSADELDQIFSGLPNLNEIERRYYRMAARFEIEFGNLVNPVNHVNPV